jgi:hypothetical protein
MTKEELAKLKGGAAQMRIEIKKRKKLIII